jgi:methylglutaconyl-CoA hydratase
MSEIPTPNTSSASTTDKTTDTSISSTDTSSDTAPVLLHFAGEAQQIAVVTLNRPAVRNALSPALLMQLQEILRRLASDQRVRAVVLTGAGGVFSSGADLAVLQALSGQRGEEQHADAQLLAETLYLLYTLPKPTIAAIEGAAVAGGAGLATACDLLLLGESARIGYTEVRLGFVAAIVSVFLLRAVGEKHARELLLTGRLVDAAHAYRIGLVNEVVADGEVLSHALTLATELANNPTSALAASKEALAVLPDMGLDEGLRYAARLNAWIRNTADLREGVAAFLEKRPPSWRAK